MPTIEPMTEMPLSTVGKIGRLIGPSVSGGSPTQTSRPPRRSDGERLLEDGGDDGGTTATSTPPSSSIAATGSLVAGVDDVVGAQLAGQLELGVVDVDGDHGAADQAGVLDGEVAEPADAEDRDSFAGLDVGDLDRLVGRDAGAGQRGGVERADTPSGTGTT